MDGVRKESREKSSIAFLVALEALIFDFDGTIAETERDGHRVAYNEAFADLGLPWNWDVATYGKLLAVAGGKERLVHFIATLAKPHDYDPMSVAVRVHAQKVKRFASIAPTLTLRPGLVRLVAEAKAAGVRLAIATTASEDGVRAVLQTSPDTLSAFDLIAAGDVVPHKKPAPDVYTYVLDHLGIDAKGAVAFEDSAIGLTAARAAGIATVVSPSIYTERESFDGAAVVVTSLGEENSPAKALIGTALPRGLVDLEYLRTVVA